MKFFIVLAIIIYIGITFLLGWSLMKTLKAFQVWRWPYLYWTVFVLLAASMFLSRMTDIVIFQIVGNYWMYFLEYGLIVTLLGLLIYWITPWKNIKVIGGTGVFLVLFFLAVGSYLAYVPKAETLQLEINKDAEDLRVVVASDFHLGVLSTKNHLERFVKLTNEQKPDIVLLVGDIIDDDPKWFIDENMGETLAKLETTYGVYGILGNHEYYGDKIELFVSEIEKYGVTMLLDETVLIADKFYLTGQEDWANKKRLSLADLKPEDEMKPWIVMNHTPMELQVPAQLGVDLQVSGHTHKGQMWPNQLLTSRIYELDYGHLLKEETNFLVSSGFGFWGPPIRTNSQAEIWVIDLQFTK